MPMKCPTLQEETAEFLEEHKEWLVRLEALKLAYDPKDYANSQSMEGTRAFLEATKLLMAWLLEGFDETDLFELSLREAIRRGNNV